MKQQTSEWVVDLSNPNADKITSGSTTNVSISNKQSMTAVDWLMDRFLFAGYGLPSEWREQAKAMEKEQIINGHFAGWEDAYDYLINVESNERARQAEEYYNETYNEEV